MIMSLTLSKIVMHKRNLYSLFKRTVHISCINTSKNLNYGNKPEHQKIYELRSYAVQPKDFKEQIKLIEEYLHLRTRHSKLFGFWNAELGALNELIHLWEFDSHDHRVKARLGVTGDKEWQTEFIQKAAPMWISQTNATLKLLPWSSISLPAKSGVYELQTFQMNSHTDIWHDRLKAAAELTSEKLKEVDSTLVACFYSMYGPHNTVYVLWHHTSYDNFAFGVLQKLDESSKSILHAFNNEVLSGYSKGLIPLKLHNCGENSIHR